MEEENIISIENIKKELQEPEVQFVLLLPAFQPERTLGGELIKVEKSDSNAEDQVKLRVKSIRRSRKSSETFICDLCGKTLEEREKFRRHLFSHIKPFKCDCGKSFGSRQNLNQHKSTHDEDRTRFSCIFCLSTSYSTKGSLDYHIKTFHFTIGEKFKCDKCKYEGKTKDHLKQHQKTHQKSFKYSKCDKRFSTNRILKNHLKKHDKPDEFVCLCSKVFKSSRDLKHHKTMMHKAGEPIKIDDGTYTCNICHKIFGSKDHLKTHMLTHEEKKKCPICFEMLTVLCLKDHIRLHQLKEEGKQFKCQKCSKAFLTSQYLKDHLKWHNKQFECDICGHRFARKIETKQHIIKRHIIEVDVVTYTCNICHKIFGRKKYLKTHMLTHEEKKKCPICFKMFTVRSLMYHIQRHQLKEEGKKFKCQKCSKAFLASRELKQHLKRHNKQFECDFCGHRVALKEQIKNHIKRHNIPIKKKT